MVEIKPVQPVPTQVQHPARTMLRTGVQVAVALVTLLPYVVTEAQIPATGMFAQVVMVAMFITKIMSLPRVVNFLREFAPWLSPDGGMQTPQEYDEGLRGQAKAHDGTAGS